MYISSCIDYSETWQKKKNNKIDQKPIVILKHMVRVSVEKNAQLSIVSKICPTCDCDRRLISPKEKRLITEIATW